MTILIPYLSIISYQIPVDGTFPAHHEVAANTAVGMYFAVLLPQQVQRHAPLGLQFLMKAHKIGPGPAGSVAAQGMSEQLPLPGRPRSSFPAAINRPPPECISGTSKWYLARSNNCDQFDPGSGPTRTEAEPLFSFRMDNLSVSNVNSSSFQRTPDRPILVHHPSH